MRFLHDIAYPESTLTTRQLGSFIFCLDPMFPFPGDQVCAEHAEDVLPVRPRREHAQGEGPDARDVPGGR